MFFVFVQIIIVKRTFTSLNALYVYYCIRSYKYTLYPTHIANTSQFMQLPLGHSAHTFSTPVFPDSDEIYHNILTKIGFGGMGGHLSYKADEFCTDMIAVVITAIQATTIQTIDNTDSIQIAACQKLLATLIGLDLEYIMLEYTCTCRLQCYYCED